MRERARTCTGSFARLGAAAAVTTLMAVAAVSCGGGSDDAAPGEPAAAGSGALDGSSTGGADAANGEQLSRSSGCAGCHGPDFGGGAGPAWTGLTGSEVTLVDGGTVVADTAYLTRAIADPAADLVADYSLKMPANNLTDAEIADIVAFIETLVDE